MHDELVHYGVLGMKWGVRRTKAQLARARGGTVQKKTAAAKAPDIKTPKPKAKSESESQKKTQSEAPKKKSISEMTDEELNRAVRRLQLEKQYRDLNPKTVSAGEKIAQTVMNQVLVPAATEAGKQLLKDYLIKAGSGSSNSGGGKKKK